MFLYNSPIMPYYYQVRSCKMLPVDATIVYISLSVVFGFIPSSQAV